MYYKSTLDRPDWLREDDEPVWGERYDTVCLIGLPLKDVRAWAENLCSTYGEDKVLLDLCLDEEFPSIEIDDPED